MTSNVKTSAAGLVLALVTLGVPSAPAIGSDSDYGGNYVKLKVISPQKGSHKNKPVLFRSGGQLTFRMTARWSKVVGIGIMGPITDGWLNWFPEEEGPRGAIVFDNPDSLWSLANPEQELPWPVDELMMAFRPDRGDLTGAGDGSFFSREIVQLSTGANRPQFGGPALPEPNTVQDGVGYGADDNLPGLVILSDTGVGVVMEPRLQGRVEYEDCDQGPGGGPEEFSDPGVCLVSTDGIRAGCAVTEGGVRFCPRWMPSPPAPYVPATTASRRNLAGFLSSVGWELNDKKDRIAITASLVTPRHLFSDIALRDSCIGDTRVVLENTIPPYLDCIGGTAKYQLSGDTGLRDLAGPLDEAVDRNEYVTLTAFVVASNWTDFDGFPPPGELTHPDVIVDCNGDGVADVADASCMGYTVLSNVVTVRFRQVLNHMLGDCTWDLGSDVWVDLDGNGVSQPLTANCPGGGGSIRRF